METKIVILICEFCGVQGEHLVSSRIEHWGNGLPYIQCYRRCEACGFERPTPADLNEVDKHTGCLVGPRENAQTP